jgi:manganese efflux pump family protein
MKWVALIAWVLTAGGGFVLLAIWLSRGGMRQREKGRIRPALILTHFLLAAIGLVIWIIYVATDNDTTAWIALAILAGVALLGFGMLFVWLEQRQVRGGAAPEAVGAVTGRPAEQHFPVPIVALHGVLAATTIVLVALTAGGVGGS